MSAALLDRAENIADMAEAAEAAGEFDRAHDLFDRAAGLFDLADSALADAMRQRARTAAATTVRVASNPACAGGPEWIRDRYLRPF